MPVSDELVEIACAAEQDLTGRNLWPEQWMPELAAEYRESMRVFLASIVPIIEADALEHAARIAEMHSGAPETGQSADQAALIAASIRTRIDELSGSPRMMGFF
jgi:hypothetical protein